MSTISNNQPSQPIAQVPTADGVLHLPLQNPPSAHSASPSDPEKQVQLSNNNTPNSLHHWAGRPKSGFVTRLIDVFLLPFNMFAPRPDYDLAQRLSSHPDERVHNGLYHVLIGAQNLRTQQWRLAYWIVSASLICTLGTALIGIATAILSFNDHPLASKTLSIILAVFGVILSLLKGTGQPVNAFTNFNISNDIIDSIEDFSISADSLDITRIDEIKTAWRGVRDNTVAEQATVWKNLQK